MRLTRRQVLATGAALAAFPSLALADTIPVTGRPVPELAAFDQVMQNLTVQFGATAGSLAMTYRGRLVFARGYGEAVQPDSPFRLASVSKAITAIAVMRAWQDGLVRLDAPVRTYLDMQPIPGKTADPRLDRVTVSDLLYHTGGMLTAYSEDDPLFQDIAVARVTGASLPVSQWDIIRYVTGMPLESDPGTRYSYSNYGYLLLGRIIEAVSGTTYERYVQQVLSRIGITRMQIAKPFEHQRAPGEVRYVGQEQGPTVYDASGRIVPSHYGGYNTGNVDANGGWIASAIDLVRILSTIQTPSNMLLGAAALQEMLAVPPIGRDADGSWHGRGWIVRPGVGINIAGSLPGTSTLMERRDDGVAWAALWNNRDLENPLGLQIGISEAIYRLLPSITRWPDHDLFADQRLYSIGYSGL